MNLTDYTYNVCLQPPPQESWQWSGGCWIYNYMCNQSLSPLTLWVRNPFMARCTRYNICDKVCHWLSTGRWFSRGTPVSSTNKTDRYDITEILLKVALNTINHPTHLFMIWFSPCPGRFTYQFFKEVITPFHIE